MKAERLRVAVRGALLGVKRVSLSQVIGRLDHRRFQHLRHSQPAEQTD